MDAPALGHQRRLRLHELHGDHRPELALLIARRARGIESTAGARTAEELAALLGIANRTQILYVAIACTLAAGVLASLIVLLLFANAFVETNLSDAIDICFIGCAVALVVSLSLFLAEVGLAAMLLRRRRRQLLRAQAEGPAEMPLGRP